MNKTSEVMALSASVPGLAVRGLLDLLLPPRCPSCGTVLARARPPLCPLCLEVFEKEMGGECLRCGSPAAPGRLLCPPCRAFGPLADLSAIWSFGGPLADAVWALKRTAAPELVEFFAGALAERLGEMGWPVAKLLPVPMHRQRLGTRGFNQATLLARRLGKLCGLPLSTDALVRTRSGPPQASLSGSARRRNLVGAFCVPAEAALAGPFCLIDDVVTTGATLLACAEALRAAGAKQVFALCVARTPLD